MVARSPASSAPQVAASGGSAPGGLVCHVWIAPVGAVPPAGDREAPPGGLSPAEVRRWSAYRQPADRARFAAGVALQHRALLELTGVDAPLVRSCPGCGSDEHGPVSPGGSLAGRASMSLSHSKDLVVVSVVETPPGTAPVRVGVDVESCRTRREGIDELVSTPAERVADATEPDPGCALMTRWTRKEAVLKAVGVGLMVPMTQVVLSPAGLPPRVLAVGDHPGLAGLAPEAAYLTDLAHPLLGDSYHASVCVLGADAAVVLRRA